MLQTLFFYNWGQGHSDPKTVCDTLWHKDVSTDKIWDSYLNNMRYATDTIFLELKPEVMVTVIQKQCVTLHKLMMCPQTKFGIPISNNTGDLLQTQFF